MHSLKVDVLKLTHLLCHFENASSFRHDILHFRARVLAIFSSDAQDSIQVLPMAKKCVYSIAGIAPPALETTHVLCQVPLPVDLLERSREGAISVDLAFPVSLLFRLVHRCLMS